MRILLQRADWGRVTVGETVVGEIGKGVVLLVGVAPGDSESVVDAMVKKVVNLRIFEDEAGKMNLSLLDCGGGALVVSQFTLFADCTKGRRPYFGNAGAPEHAKLLCDQFAGALREKGIFTQTGEFGSMMQVELSNNGPVTIWLDSNDLRRAGA